MKQLHLSLVLTASLAAAAASRAQGDVSWQTNLFSKDLHRINACGEIELRIDLSGNNHPANTSARLGPAYSAPDGQVWVLALASHLTLLNPDGSNIRNVDTAGGGRPIEIAFDKAGSAYVTTSGTPAVEVYSPAGAFQRSYAFPGGDPFGITIDADGMVWVAHVSGPPAKISRINPTTNVVTDFPFPNAATTAGGRIAIDYQGPLQDSVLWCNVDRTAELVSFDTKGKHLGTYTIPGAASITTMAVDAYHSLWVGSFLSPTIYQFDTTRKRVGKTIQNAPNTLGLAIDTKGHLLATARPSVVGPQRSLVQRFDTITGIGEHTASTGFGASAPAGTRFLHAFVVDPLGDADSDGVSNFNEISQRSDPYDDQSRPQSHLIVAGANERRGAIDVSVLGQAGATAVLGFATQRAAAPICNAGWSGCLRIDPGTLTPFLFTFTLPSILQFNVPNDPTLVGTAAYFQAIYDLGSGTPTWGNVDCVNIWR